MERAVNSATAGSGIGLFVVRELAGPQGGRAWVEAAPGGGARFVIELLAVSANGSGPLGSPPSRQPLAQEAPR
jgi:two-component system OmpR family sensor kinase